MNTGFYEYRPLQGLASVLKTMLAINMLICAISLVSDVMEVNLLQKMDRGIETTSEEENSNDNRQQLLGIVIIVYSIPLMIVFGKWIYRSAANMHVVAPGQMTITPGWCVGWYFIPFLNLIRPFQAMVEIWKTSEARPGEHTESLPTPGLLRLWWGLWILVGILGQISFRIVTNAESIEMLIVSDYFSISQEAAEIVLSFVAMTMVAKITEMQLAKGEESVGQTEGEQCSECGEMMSASQSVCPMCGALVSGSSPQFDF